ncbi:acyl-coenzyme A thioesterase 9, mitochondrial-like isoform X2 [Ruditapes philippinarum]|uniref:acyl-coenzyme A thioesterase 9, mitochondrial-like isoform X2 n=1 Tax=Ruditapes philippinarum TaxID=129788 RepID=UPI00295BE3D6|nr:acyl-coenzyme A thioesterase 9, mitochondrial-like isoform X2 [Ruditapes philippinarum]
MKSVHMLINQGRKYGQHYIMWRRKLWSNTDGTQDGVILTIHETREKLKSLVGAQLIWGSSTEKQDVLPVASSQDELPVRSMSDSFRKAIIPLGSNPRLKEKYTNYYNGIRFGRILEDLDTFAVAISYTHTMDSCDADKKSPLSIVTALVDRIELSQDGIVPDKDIKMSGKVTWAGKTSMEITMELEQEIDNEWKRILDAKFLMVARNPVTKSSAVINKLQPNTTEEERLFKLGEECKAKRMLESKKTLLKEAPDEEERLLIHNLFLETMDPNAHTFKVRIKPENSAWMEETILKNLVICMPEQRNLYNKIFGGFLMRKAFELAFANASLFCKSRPHIEVVDDIAFKKSVEVGSFLFLSSEIVYTLDTRLLIKVHAEVVNPFDESRETTNDFYFVFNTRDVKVRRVIPKTYAESMLYLDGKRHFEH